MKISERRALVEVRVKRFITIPGAHKNPDCAACLRIAVAAYNAGRMDEKKEQNKKRRAQCQ